MIHRRALLAAPLVLIAAPSAGAAEAQPKALAMLLLGSPEASAPEYAAFTQQLDALGWSEGRNLLVHRHWAASPDQFIGLANEAVRAAPAVILSAGPDATRAAQQATATIPIVMIASTDPRVMGVASLAHPGGNLTGLTVGQQEATTEKLLQLAKEALPQLASVAVVWDVRRSTDSGGALARMAGAAGVLGLRLHHLDVDGANGFAAAFGAAKLEGAEAVLLVEGPRAVASRAKVAELGLDHRLPIVGQFSRLVDAGTLLSYGPDLNDLFRRAASYVDKILKGANPAGLPIEQPTKLELVVNTRTAKALSLTLPASFLMRADRTIE